MFSLRLKRDFCCVLRQLNCSFARTVNEPITSVSRHRTDNRGFKEDAFNVSFPLKLILYISLKLRLLD